MTKKNIFDTTKLTGEDKSLLEVFQKRRIIIQNFIDENDLKLTVCPGCGFPSFPEDWFHNICSVCNWQHDGQDDPHADEIWGGPNYELSLTENRLNICRTLKEKSQELGGNMKEEPDEILDALKGHQERMNLFDEDEMMHAFRDDPIWKDWDIASKEILNDLIKK